MPRSTARDGRTMPRLTARDGRTITYIGRHTKLPGLECAGSMRVAAIREVMELLADYEDTGLTPDEIVKMQENLRKN